MIRYHSISGVHMGSSLTPILANIFMDIFETQLIEDIPADLRPDLREMTMFEEFLLCPIFEHGQTQAIFLLLAYKCA